MRSATLFCWFLFLRCLKCCLAQRKCLVNPGMAEWRSMWLSIENKGDSGTRFRGRRRWEGGYAKHLWGNRVRPLQGPYKDKMHRGIRNHLEGKPKSLQWKSERPLAFLVPIHWSSLFSSLSASFPFFLLFFFPRLLSTYYVPSPAGPRDTKEEQGMVGYSTSERAVVHLTAPKDLEGEIQITPKCRETELFGQKLICVLCVPSFSCCLQH